VCITEQQWLQRSIQCLQCEVERIFNSAKLTLSERRALLDCEIVEALECLRHWDAAGMISWWDVQ
jgi:hypothetical protein